MDRIKVLLEASGGAFLVVVFFLYKGAWKMITNFPVLEEKLKNLQDNQKELKKDMKEIRSDI